MTASSSGAGGATSSTATAGATGGVGDKRVWLYPCSLYRNTADANQILTFLSELAKKMGNTRQNGGLVLKNDVKIIKELAVDAPDLGYCDRT